MEHPQQQGRPVGLWVQYLLDRAETVAEALDLLDTFQPVMFSAHGHAATVHLAMEDATGDSAIAGTAGTTTADKVSTYATILAGQSALRYPGVAAAATTARAANTGLDHIADVTDLLAAHPDLDLASTGIDHYVAAQTLTVAAPVLSQLKLLQRVHRISTDPATTAALISSGIHSATQLAFLGRTAGVATLTAAGIDARSAATTVGKAEFQYAAALAQFTDYRLELHQTDPVAIVSHAWTKLEEQAILGQIPDLEVLFGSLDFCDCVNCVSLTSPSAYLVDVLRFLSRHPATTAGRTAADVLLARRPDLANIKLNALNTDTPMPYVDLVCEVLESAVPAAAPNFAFQSTRPAAELRAFPEHIRPEAYAVLSTYDGLGGAFDVAQEEIRAWLGQLGAPRPVLMATLQSGIGSGTVVATSTGQNDGGVFELSLGDERYLPFEHSGAVSSWTLTLPARSNNFNVDSITDVIIHLRYTAAAADSADLTAQALSNLDAVRPTRGSGLLALKNQFSTAWSRFLSPPDGQDQELVVTIGPEHLPFFARGRTAALTGIDLFVEAPGTGAMEYSVLAPTALTPLSGVAPAEAGYGNLRHASAGVAAPSATGEWRIKLRAQGPADFRSLTRDDLRNLYLVVRLQLS